MFTNWVELRDIVSPRALTEQLCISNKKLGKHTDSRIADAADLIFVHLVQPDHSGHDAGWNSEEYTASLNTAMTLAGELAQSVSILDIAPTAAHLLGIPLCEDWEGCSVFS